MCSSALGTSGGEWRWGTAKFRPFFEADTNDRDGYLEWKSSAMRAFPSSCAGGQSCLVHEWQHAKCGDSKHFCCCHCPLFWPLFSAWGRDGGEREVGCVMIKNDKQNNNNQNPRIFRGENRVVEWLIKCDAGVDFHCKLLLTGTKR